MAGFIILMSYFFCVELVDAELPLVINTWGFTSATSEAWNTLTNGGSVLDSVEIGCTTCELEQCDGTVGYGGSPDESGETTLDAMIMDGKTMNVGAVGALRYVRSAVSVARYVLEHTEHTLLVGSQASKFAYEMGFSKESLATNNSVTMWAKWQARKCQPNYWVGVTPDSKTSCGPYTPINTDNFVSFKTKKSAKSYDRGHDTIGMVAIDKKGNVAVATSTNGLKYKIPGRVGDSPIVGAGGYAENGIGGAAATGDGDILMRFLPSFKAIEGLRANLSATEAAKNALNNIPKYYPKFVGGIVVATVDGKVGAACYGIDEFPYSVVRDTQASPVVVKVKCIPSSH